MGEIYFRLALGFDGQARKRARDDGGIADCACGQRIRTKQDQDSELKNIHWKWQGAVRDFLLYRWWGYTQPLHSVVATTVDPRNRHQPPDFVYYNKGYRVIRLIVWLRLKRRAGIQRIVMYNCIVLYYKRERKAQRAIAMFPSRVY